MVDHAKQSELGGPPVIIPITPKMRRFLSALPRQAGNEPTGGSAASSSRRSPRGRSSGPGSRSSGRARACGSSSASPGGWGSRRDGRDYFVNPGNSFVGIVKASTASRVRTLTATIGPCGPTPRANALMPHVLQKR